MYCTCYVVYASTDQMCGLVCNLALFTLIPVTHPFDAGFQSNLNLPCLFDVRESHYHTTFFGFGYQADGTAVNSVDTFMTVGIEKRCCLHAGPSMMCCVPIRVIVAC